MDIFRKVCLLIAALAAVTFAASAALAQPHDTHQPKHEDKTASPATDTKTDDRIGDPYPLDTCPITGKKLGTMGDPVTKLYKGREVRFCCPVCPPKFEKDLKASMATLDEKIIKDQAPLYPVKTSLVTGKDLPAAPFEFVYGNRLIRLGAENEKADFLKDTKKYMGDLDKAVVAAQGKDYPLKKCPVSKEEFGGDMGKPVDFVVAGRLIRLCCKDCKKDIEKDPAKFIAAYDAARKGEKTKPDADHKDTHDDHKHSGG